MGLVDLKCDIGSSLQMCSAPLESWFRKFHCGIFFTCHDMSIANGGTGERAC